MTARPPSIRRQKVTVNGQAGRVDPIGVAELDLIEPREHAAWMQKVADILAGYAPETITAVAELLSAHKADFANPHRVTAAQTGADPAGTAAAVGGVAALNLANHTSSSTAHGVGAGNSVVGTGTTQTLTNKTLDSTNKFGGASSYTMFEADGTPVAVGDATTFDDSQAAVIYMRTGGTALTLDVLSGGVYAYRLDSTDEIHSQIQTTHKYKIGSEIHFHIHLINKNAIGATNYNVGIELEWAWAGLNGVMPAATTEATVNCSFQNASALTHKVFELKSIVPTTAQSTISSILFFRVKRVTATTQNYATNDIFLAGIDFHNEMDTLGSRQEYIK